MSARGAATGGLVFACCTVTHTEFESVLPQLIPLSCAGYFALWILSFVRIVSGFEAHRCKCGEYHWRFYTLACPRKQYIDSLGQRDPLGPSTVVPQKRCKNSFFEDKLHSNNSDSVFKRSQKPFYTDRPIWIHT